MPARPTLEELQRVVRTEICASCPWRTPGSERLDPAVPRPCETQCRLFGSLPRLRKRAVLLDPLLHSYEEVLQHQIDQILEDRGGELPPSPLNRYRRPLVGILKSLVEGQ